MTNMIDKQLQQFRPRPGFDEPEPKSPARTGALILVIVALMAAISMTALAGVSWMIAMTIEGMAGQIPPWGH